MSKNCRLSSVFRGGGGVHCAMPFPWKLLIREFETDSESEETERA